MIREFTFLVLCGLALTGCPASETITQSCSATSSARTSAGLSGAQGAEGVGESASSGGAEAEGAAGCDYAKKAE